MPDGVPTSLLARIFPQATIKEWRPVIKLKGKLLALAEAMIKHGNGTVENKTLMERIGVRRQPTFSNYINDPDLAAYLAERGVSFEKGWGKVTITSDRLVIDITKPA